MTTPLKRYIGLMSGTSIDAMDGVLVDFSSPKPILLATTSIPLTDELKHRLHELCRSGKDEVFNLGLASRDIGDVAATAVNDLISQSESSSETIVAVGFHGQTIRHHPEHSFTLQIGDASRITEQTDITTVADFRSRDIAAGGQGAPLAPFFHQALCGADPSQEDSVILNIGGIANITILPADSSNIIGFDTGPGNTLMDAWCRDQLQQPFDENGLWAESGNISPELLQALLSTPYLQQPPPKSTGRELFNPAWLQQQLKRHLPIRPEDIQATLLAFTVQTITQAIKQYAPSTRIIYTCGGGTQNGQLMKNMQQALPKISVRTTLDLGIDPQWIEATAFAWLAMQTIESRPVTLPDITGAKGNRILGAIYPA